ncbi:type IX secretion system anionic LPS delivery protein PorZ [Hymenobacter rubidus]|uniref:type IX secretion system anionic LPS delivery protein PorZ n=1 Tax=Hymenobacter rubidus TaxID=1441626 RepID=UPI00191DA5C5|nr:two-component regulator propeller domain-containing protein [Hymenobacter rubidus]
MPYIFRCFLSLAGLFLLAGTVKAQNAVGYGDWQLHLPTNHPLRLADAGDRVYVKTENAFYFLDKKQNTTQVLSSRDGLHDVGVAALAYDSVTRQTVLAYRNTNIDILRPDGSVRNLNDVLRKAIQGSKEVNQVSIGGGKAYVSTTFGLVVVDLTKLEVSDTYTNIGPGGTVVAVYDAAVANGSLFLATSAGLLRGSLTTNLLDYRNWVAYLPVALNPTQPIYRFLAVDDGKVYASVENAGVYRFVSNGWQLISGSYAYQYRGLRGSGIGVLIVDDGAGGRLIDRMTGVVKTVAPPAPNTSTQDVVRARDGSYYVANYHLGLQHVQAGVVTDSYVANGPESSLAFGLLADAHTNTVDVFTGGYSERYAPTGRRAGFYEYTNGQWTNFTSTAFPRITDFPNPNSPVRGTRTPDGTLYVANNGSGLLEWKGVGNFRQFGEGVPTGSPLLGTFGGGNSRVEVTDVAATAEGKVWVINRHLQAGNSGLFIFDPVATTWQTIPWVSGLEVLERMALDDNGYAWVSVSRKTDGTSVGGPSIGIYAVDPALVNPRPPRLFNTSSGLPDNQIYDVAKDRRGYIWVATIKGVVYYNDPSGPFNSTTGFTLPRVEKGEGTGFPPLWTEAVLAIAVDGADRKWFGTNNGLWLFSADASEALAHFTTANSPLPSNRIVDVKVNDKTGEVWVATDAGVVTYRGSATVTEGTPNCTAAFPNPVRPDFQGVVGITGLANNALVKITDVAGHLVYATTATGGAVTWNLTNPNGERVRSGMYLVLSTDADGKNGCVSKVAVLSR